MLDGIHFIAGLPRFGSTLLAALLRQNASLHANITRLVGSMVGALIADMSAGNETSVFVDDAQRTAVLRGLFKNYYGVHQAGNGRSSCLHHDNTRPETRQCFSDCALGGSRTVKPGFSAAGLPRGLE